MLKLEDLKVGDELFDCDGVLHTVVRIDCWEERVYIDTEEMSYFVLFCDLNSFKKKEQSQYTFDDLIDVAVQAKKDKIIGNLFIEDTYVNFDSGNGSYDYGITCLSSGINFIKSLYKETFVIESVEQMNEITIKKDAKVTLENGMQLTNSHLEDLCKFTNEYTFVILKGATVEQSK